MKKTISVLVLICVFGYSKAQLTAKVYEDPSLSGMVAAHTTVAILPMDVTVKDVKSNKKNRMTLEEIKDAEESYRSGFQNSMYSWFLKMKKKGKFLKEIQDVTRTNALLKKNGIADVETLSEYTMDDIAKMLEVDAVFFGSVITTKSMSAGGAFAIAAITGIGVKTGDADVVIRLYDGQEGKMIWSFDRTVSSSYSSSPDEMVDYLMKRVSKRFPYKL